MTRLPGTVVFDLDGTLVDSIADIAAAMNRAFAEEGLDGLPVETYRELVGEGATVTLTRGLTLLTGVADADRVEALHERFVHHYEIAPASHSLPYPGVVALLDALGAAGTRLAVCTNKDHGATLAILDALDLARHFQAIVGVTPELPRKPHRAMLEAAVAGAGGNLADAVMIGDSKTDVALARAGGVPVIAVSFGYSQTPARALGADVVIDHYDEALGALATLAARRVG
ncbi:MAG: HAD-IA family hydrolase [Hyphomicrobiaceae bacterium]